MRCNGFGQMVLVVVGILIASTAYGQRRVFTNEDIATTPPPVSAAVTEDAAIAPATEPVSPPPAEEAAQTPAGELRRLQSLETALDQALDEITARSMRGGVDDATATRWNELRDCMIDFLIEFRTFVAEAEEVAGAVQPASPGAAPEPTQ